MGEQFKIIEYPLIILFIVSGAIFLVSTSDLRINFSIYRITKLWFIFT